MHQLPRSPTALAMVCATLLIGSACGSTHGDGQTAGPPVRGENGAPSTATLGTHPAPPAHAAKTRSTPSPQAPRPDSGTAAFTQTVLPASTPIDSALYHDALVKAVEKAGKKAVAGQAIADCMQQILQRAGIQTVGEARRIKQDPTGDEQVAKGALQCLASAAP